tara:strand:+ start:569 stop:697 length:129 start_codon:yes stop_codon:yes gene_type:complete
MIILMITYYHHMRECALTGEKMPSIKEKDRNGEEEKEELEYR